MPTEPRDALLAKVIEFAARDGVADRSLREIAAGAGTSHRMLLYHFGSREGLLAAIVGAIEVQQRAAMAELAAASSTPRELMLGLWQRVSSPELRPFVRLFFEVFALATHKAQGAEQPPGTPGSAQGTEQLLATLTSAWLDDATALAARLGWDADPAALRLGVAVSRGLLLDLLAGAGEAEVDAAYELFVRIYERATLT